MRMKEKREKLRRRKRGVLQGKSHFEASITIKLSIIFAVVTFIGIDLPHGIADTPTEDSHHIDKVFMFHRV